MAEITNWPNNQLSTYQMSRSKVEKYSKFIFWSGSEKQVFLTFAGEKMENHYFRQRVGNSHACHAQ